MSEAKRNAGKDLKIRSNLRKIAVNCIFSYDFAKAELETRPEPEIVMETVKVKTAGKSRRITNKTLEEVYRELHETFEIPVEKKITNLSDVWNNEQTETLIAAMTDFTAEVYTDNGEMTREPKNMEKLRESKDYNEYLIPTVKGVIANLGEIDKNVNENLKNWTTERLKKTVLAVLRVAFYELMFLKGEIPTEVAVNEAVEIVKEYEDDEAGSFVNGVLRGYLRSLS